jgi:acyl-CoA synthetase (NDP forming)
MAWLQENGIPVPAFRFAENAAEAVAGAQELGYPVVMKVVSPQILHKSDAGGVKLHLTDEEAVVTAFHAIAEAAAGRDFRGVVLYPQLEGGTEVLLGLSRDPQFGPVVVFGLGGIYTEVLHDIALRVAPVDRREAEAMVREVRSYPILEGVRGQPPRDVEALIDLLVAFSRLPFLYPNVAEVDLNPVFVFGRGEGVLVGDVRVIGRE